MPYYTKARKRVRRRPVRKTVKRRRLNQKRNTAQSIANVARAVNNMYPVAKEAYSLYNTYRSGRKFPNQKKRMRQVEEGTGAYNQWSQRYSQATLGKLTNKKLVRDQLETTVFKWTNLKRFGGQGSYLLGHYTGADTNLYLPCMLIELNSINNFTNGALSVYSPVRHMFKGSSGNYGFVPINGLREDGTSLPQWHLERSSHTALNPQSYPNDSSIWKWCSMEFEFWGMKNYPTKWSIQLVQLNEDVTPSSVPTGTSFVTDDNAEEFWDSLIKPYSYSPLVHQKNGFAKKKYKLLKQYSINIDPTASFENDASPHCKTFKLFYRMNRKCQFDWKYTNAAGQTQATIESGNWQVEDQENQVQVHPNARMYLLIRASNFEQQPNLAACTSANTPSFTAVIRNCHIINT